jgi:uncharacterized membrane protein YeaQ/YmgE (transglycosylase-associated protein family)
MDLLVNAIVGLIVGVLAKWIMKTGPSGLILTACLGIAGSMVGTVLFRAIGLDKAGDGVGIIGSVIGAVILLWAYGKFLVKK